MISYILFSKVNKDWHSIAGVIESGAFIVNPPF